MRLTGTRLTERLGIRTGIIQAPMAGASNPDLVAAVSNAGGLGSLGAAPMPPEALERAVHAIRQQTDAPFNINLFHHSLEQFDGSLQPGPAQQALLRKYHDELSLDDIPSTGTVSGPFSEQLDVLIAAKVPIISLHFGIEADDVERIHSAGLKVLCTATTVQEAWMLDGMGVDVIIAQGAEAGGHRGTFIDYDKDSLVGTMALVPRVAESVSVPVVAAGGIMDGRGIVAALALGAEGAQMGTAFLGCAETGLPEAWHNKLRESEGNDTTVTSAVSGKPARGIRNRYINENEALGEPLLPYPQQYSLSGKLRKAAAQADNPDFLAMWSGQGVGMIQRGGAGQLIQRWESGVADLLGNADQT